LENDLNQYEVYALLDPRCPTGFTVDDRFLNYTPFYIGKGLPGRLLSHLQNCSRGLINNCKQERINEIRKDGLEPLFYIFDEFLSEMDALKLERKLIQLIGREDLNKGPLLNLNNGSTIVYQYDYYNGVFTGKVFKNTCIASRYYGLNKSTIGKVCTGKLASAGGYRWSYEKDNNWCNIEYNQKNWPIIVEQIHNNFKNKIKKTIDTVKTNFYYTYLYDAMNNVWLSNLTRIKKKVN
jgi:hypothetical protein